jgi:hypothetical protein
MRGTETGGGDRLPQTSLYSESLLAVDRRPSDLQPAPHQGYGGAGATLGGKNPEPNQSVQ